MLVGGDVIGMTIAAGFVKGNEYLGTELANDLDDFAHHFGGISLKE